MSAAEGMGVKGLPLPFIPSGALIFNQPSNYQETQWLIRAPSIRPYSIGSP